MTATPRSLIAAAAVACLCMLAFAPVAFAECPPGSLPLMADDQLVVGDAFLATVTGASADVDPNPDGAAYDWHIELSVEATYVGSAPKSFGFNGWAGGGCGDLNGEVLRTGDRIIIAAEDLRPEYQPGDPFEGHVVLWRETSDGWSFYADALLYGAEPQAYPKAARDATTKAEILELISAGAMPATATHDALRRPEPNGFPILVGLAAALGFLIALRRFGPLRTSAAASDIRRR